MTPEEKLITIQNSHKLIPVETARKVADDFRKDIMLLIGWDTASNTTDIVTWGREPAQKEAAASGGDTIRKALKLEDISAREDFRREGEAARTVDALRRQLVAIREAIDKIVVTDGEDAGVILLSDESPTHYSELAKCQVYDFDNFSPLGDALVALAKLAETTN